MLEKWERAALLSSRNVGRGGEEGSRGERGSRLGCRRLTTAKSFSQEWEMWNAHFQLQLWDIQLLCSQHMEVEKRTRPGCTAECFIELTVQRYCADLNINAAKTFHFSRLALIQMHHFLQPIKELLRGVDDDLKPCFCYQGHLFAATLDPFMCPVSNREGW